MEHTVLEYLQAQQLVQKGMKITVALSGGADSMALLAVLYQLRPILGITVCAAHFNHKLRGEEAARDEAFVRDWCKAKNIPLSVGSADVKLRAAQTGESIEEAARKLRYAFFESLETDLIATAHTAEDNAETLLLHLLRGTGPRGMCGIPAKRGRYIRPFLTVSHAQIRQYLAAHDIPHIEDSTNALDDCVRNRIRHHVMPELLRENPQFLSAVGKSTQLHTQEEAFLSELAAQAAADCRDKDGYSCQKLRKLHPVLLQRVLLGALRDLQLENPAMCYVEALVRLVQSEAPSAAVSLPQGKLARREYDRLLFTPPKKMSFAPVTLPIPGSVRLEACSMTVRCFVTENSKICQKNTDTICLKYDMIAQTLTLRPRMSGDALRLHGGTKTVKKLMIDRKIPALQRDLLPVIALDGSIAAVYSLGIDRAFLPEAEKPCLVIEFQKESHA